MKSRLKTPPTEARADRRRGRGWWLILRLTGFALILSVLLILFALLVAGLPPKLVRRITAEFRAAGIPLQVGSIRLSAHCGWVFNDVRLYSPSPDDLQPLLSAKKIYLLPWPVDWRHPSTSGWHLRIQSREIAISPGRIWEEKLPTGNPFRTVKKLDATLLIQPETIAVNSTTLQWGGLGIHAQGVCRRTGRATAPEPRPESATTERDLWLRRAARAAETINRLQYGRPPELDLRFQYDPQNPLATELEATLTAGNILWRDRVYSSLSAVLSGSNQVWRIDPFILGGAGSGQLTLHGEANIATGTARLSAKNNLSTAELFNLLPGTLQSAVAQTGIQPGESFEFTADAGPAPFALLAEQLRFNLRKTQLTWNDITLAPLSLQAARDGNRITIDSFDAQANGGPVTGSATYHLDSNAWTAQVRAQCDPTPVGIFAGGELQEFIARFQFSGPLPQAALTLSQAGTGAPLAFNGTLRAEQFTCGGVPVDRLDTVMDYADETLRLAPLNLSRDSGEQFHGEVRLDFIQSLSWFSATNSFPPVDIVRALAPEVPALFEELRFEAPLYAAGSGQLDYNTWTNHSFRGIVRAARAGLGRADITNFQSEVEGRGAQLLFTNATATFCGGTVAFSAEFDTAVDDGNAPYHIQARLNGIRLEQLLSRFSTADYSRTHGTLAASLDLSVNGTAGFWETAHGNGSVEVTDGHLTDLPFFGGFSRLMKSAFPGFKLFSMTGFAADYELRESTLYSDNARLNGAFFSARGRGRYAPDRGLDFTVTAEPLRQADGESPEWYELQRWAAGALKEGTLPLFRLLEFKLEGPIDNPKWYFVNLPSGFPTLLRRSE